jgi:hypothetical protein
VRAFEGSRRATCPAWWRIARCSKCLDAFPPGGASDQFTIQHACQAVLSAMFAADDILAAGEAERLTRLGDEYSSLAGLDIPLEAA